MLIEHVVGDQLFACSCWQEGICLCNQRKEQVYEFVDNIDLDAKLSIVSFDVDISPI